MLRLFFLSCLCLFAIPQKGDARESYRSSGVKVSKTASSSAEARRRALREAEQKAFKEVAGRVFPQYRLDLEREPLDPRMASAAVTEIDINGETVTDRHYGGEFAIRFNPSLMKEVLRRQYGAKGVGQATGRVAVTDEPSQHGVATGAKPVVPERVEKITESPNYPTFPQAAAQALLSKPPMVSAARKPEHFGDPIRPAVMPEARLRSFGVEGSHDHVSDDEPGQWASKRPSVIPAVVPAPIGEENHIRASTGEVRRRVEAASNVTILPVLEQSKQALQWDYENPWLSSWRKIAGETERFVLPQIGDPVLHPLMLGFIGKKELQEVDRKLIENGYPGPRAGGKLYMAAGSYYYSSEDRGPVIETHLYQLAPRYIPGAVAKVVKRKGESLESLADRAARAAYIKLSPALPVVDIAARAEASPDEGGEDMALSSSADVAKGCSGKEAKETIRVLAQEIQEWLTVKDRLKSAKGVKSVRPKRLSPGNMLVELVHECSAPALAASLKQAGLPYDAGTKTIAQGTLPKKEKPLKHF